MSILRNGYRPKSRILPHLRLSISKKEYHLSDSGTAVSAFDAFIFYSLMLELKAELKKSLGSLF